VEASAAVAEGSPGSNMAQAELTADDPVRERDSVNDAGRSFESFEQLAAAVKELQVVVSAPLSITSPPGVVTYRSRRRRCVVGVHGVSIFLVSTLNQLRGMQFGQGTVLQHPNTPALHYPLARNRAGARARSPGEELDRSSVFHGTDQPAEARLIISSPAHISDDV
jgi:hypothetical protein